MISLMKDFEIMRNSPPSVTATADRPFLGMDNPQEGAAISDGGYGGVSSELRVFPVVDSAENMSDLEAGVSEIGEERVFGYLGEKVKLESDGGDEDMLSLVGEDRGSFVEPSELMHGFRVGDMVWGKVKSHPWWPGHIFNEAFASPSVRRMKGEGHVLVAFFGDSSYGWFDPAELIPFELNFPEKSSQTTSRNFVRAVEEAVDEASRRGALALACRCRNQHNYRPTSVAGYFAVDVVGYEPGGLYSSMQIKEARDHFVPLELLSFIQQLALGSCRNNGNTIEWIQTLAKLLAYRRSVFEEFDETYAQAFGVEPLRPSYNSVGVLDQTGRFAPRVAPLSGQLVVAEALGERRSSTRLASHKPARVSKNKYELKRRDELPVAATSSLSDLHSTSQQPNHAFLHSLPDSSEPPGFGMDFNYVLPKTEKPPFSPLSTVAADPSNDSKPGSEGFFLPDYLQKPEHVEIKNEWGSSASVEPTVPLEGFRGLDVVEKKGPKRPREGLIDPGEVKKNKKKKKKDGLGFDRHAVFLDVDRHGMAGGRSIAAGHRSAPDLVPQEDGINVELPPGLELSSLQLPQLIDDLSSIALDPFYGVEQDTPAIVCHVFLRFRSLVYQKSLILLGASDPAAPSQAYAGRDGRGQREPSSSSYTSKPASKFEDGTKASRKRDPSDRQEDLAVQKMKKMTRLKELASKKKDAIGKSNYLLQKQKLQQTKDHKDSASPAATEATRKQELPQRAKPPSPTFLTMKFPPRSTLPSVANLKARFARFGPLEPLATRVYWKSYSCKVLFKHKSDAQLAYDFVKNNDFFGQVKVFYNLRDVEISVPDQPPDSASHPSDSSRPDKAPLQYLHGSAGLQKPSPLQAQQSQMQLKSILKKPGSDESGSNGAAAAAGSGAIVRESPRVKFLLKADDNCGGEAPSKVAISGSNGWGQAPSLPSADQITRQSLKSVGFFPMPPLPPPSSMPAPQPLQLPYRGSEAHPYRIPSSAFQQMAAPPPPPPKEELMQPSWAPQPRSADFHSIMGQQRPLDPPDILRERGNLDISGPMLSLLLKCNEIVGKVKASLGYTPYHAL